MRLRKILPTLYLMIGCILINNLFSNSILTVSAETQEIDISTSPEKVLFEITNFKPGDWAERTLTITNSGKQDFNYLSSIKLKNGSEKLYNELLLTITDKEKTLFDGKMKDFNKLEVRYLEKNSSEKLNFKVTVPLELENDFQGLGSEVEFKFYVDGTLGGVLPVNGPHLPNTATNMFNYIVAGVGLIGTGLFLQFFLSRRVRIEKWLRRS
ncbi:MULTISPECIES: LPXTG cell wall anchor domain-containing protein [unclassified Bacillus (in: firmicutes)]|uniref:LPXTG cell wall anchor domain-containing protein n=1 Tax=unclassified Bacillus (in: firmicutes) TaxID=185979 RepID=UPI0008EC4C7A|nr:MULTISPECIES: LPXTG cell wall anchor domain-containing protein [unclassified Bacillus (in: firmicutes)]SFB13458.1 LPXTG-motif cell wall anchor domain-containing protein [Bacillus sp. UNCCL13]SFQ90010.1 LPXTG-motif cell wall anchor domain-containing protein [Bacillus sp. cl95]